MTRKNSYKSNTVTNLLKTQEGQIIKQIFLSDLKKAHVVNYWIKGTRIKWEIYPYSRPHSHHRLSNKMMSYEIMLWSSLPFNFSGIIAQRMKPLIQQLLVNYNSKIKWSDIYDILIRDYANEYKKTWQRIILEIGMIKDTEEFKDKMKVEEIKDVMES